MTEQQSWGELPGKEQAKIAFEALLRIMNLLVDRGMRPDNVVAGLLSAATHVLRKFGNEEDQQETAAWLRDIAAWIEQRPKLN